MNMLIPSSSSSLIVNSRKSIINAFSQSARQRTIISQNNINNSSITVASLCRHLSSARDTRMAGRRRFYKVVGVTDVLPPWESYNQLQQQKEGKSSKEGLKTVSSPISAGVDNSPSGVISTKGNKNEPCDEIMKRMLSLPSGAEESNAVSGSSKSGWYGITLDGSLLRTPMGHIPVSVPSFPLACAIAAEWNDQTTTIQPAQMPLMTLCCTALDQAALQPDVLVENSLRYLRNDTTCYMADPTEDRILHRKQSKYWSPVHDWINSLVHDDENNMNGNTALALASGADEGLIMSRARRKSAGLPHSEELVKYIEEWCRNLDAWSLTALQAVAMEAKSFAVAMAVVEGSLSPGKKEIPFQKDTQMAVHACRVEEEFQIENWGLVEGGHDYDRLNCSIQVHSASLLVQSIAANKKKNPAKSNSNSIIQLNFDHNI